MSRFTRAKPTTATKRVPHLYDLVVTHRRSSDIRSFWWPAGAARIGKNAVLQRIVLGSSKALMLAAVRLPWPERLAGESTPWEEQKEPAGEAVQPFVRITQYMAYDGLATLACSPHEYLLTATQNASGEVLVFRAADWEVAYQDECRPELRLSGEGGPSGLAWTESSSRLLAANPGGVTWWDIQTASATARFAAGREVTALAASSLGNTFIVGCSGGRLAWWDTRVQGLSPTGSCDTRHGPVRCAGFADADPGSNQLATGSADGHLQTWDARQLRAPLCDLSWPGSACGGVGHVAWAPSGNRIHADSNSCPFEPYWLILSVMEADDDRRTWDGSYLISPLAPGVRTEEMQLDSELVSILCHRSRRRLRDLQYTCKVTMRLDRNRHVLSLTGTDAGIEMAKQQIEGLSGPRRQVPLKVWVELMRTRTLSLDDLAEPKTVSVAWVQECSGCRLHIERSSCEVRIFGSQSGAAIASKIIDEMESLCCEQTIQVRGDPAVLSSPALQSIAHACNATFRIQGLGIAVLGLEANAARAISQLELFLDDPQGYCLPDASKQPQALQEARPKAPSTSQPKVDAEPKRAENVCPTCGSGDLRFASNAVSAARQTYDDWPFCCQKLPCCSDAFILILYRMFMEHIPDKTSAARSSVDELQWYPGQSRLESRLSMAARLCREGGSPVLAPGRSAFLMRPRRATVDQLAVQRRLC
ncbi:MSI1 [Symbiodinium sp. KB8]|nr:MSI1 [Symbiodinium sp. KB8]